MKKKIIKRRMSRLWDATVVYNYDWVDGDTYLAKEGRPIKGRQMNRLLSGGGWCAVDCLFGDGWLFRDRPKRLNPDWLYCLSVVEDKDYHRFVRLVRRD